MARTALIYWLRLLPACHRQLAIWDRRGRAIADPVLRDHAAVKLTDERLNPEAAALFAILSPASRRDDVVGLIAAYQLLYDYLDAVNEHPGSTSLANGLQLHEALCDAIEPARCCDIYAHNPQQDDTGYTQALSAACKLTVAGLPAAQLCQTTLQEAAARCGQAQAHNHALVGEGPAQLLSWCSRQRVPEDYLWWETAAAGISCLAIHALLAHAAAPETGTHEAARIDDAYFPHVCGISALMDSLADHDRDAHTDNHSFTAHYRDATHAARRLSAITVDASTVRLLPHGRRHTIILTGILAYYLSSSTMHAAFAAPVACRLAAAGGRRTQLMLTVMRLRRATTGQYSHR